MRTRKERDLANVKSMCHRAIEIGMGRTSRLRNTEMRKATILHRLSTLQRYENSRQIPNSWNGRMY